MSVERGGFVLAGGHSSRMGTDKALLPFRGKTLVEHVAAAVGAAAGSVTIIGDPARYGFTGCPVVADNTPGCGPLGGLETALSLTAADWNLVVACDMPGLMPEFLAHLFERAVLSNADCVLPGGPSGLPEPLCAVYHRRAHAAIAHELARGVRKLTDALTPLAVLTIPVTSGEWFANINTPADWSTFSHA